MEEKQLSEFLEKYSSNQHTDQEHAIFSAWIKTLPKPQLQEILAKYEEISKDNYSAPSALLIDQIESRLDALPTQPTAKTVSMWPRLISITAACLVLVSVGLFFYKNLNSVADHQQVASKTVASGGNKAILKLADGREIVLDSAKMGQLVSQDGTDVVKTDDGQVSFIGSSEEGVTAGNKVNFISIPRGGQYAIVLADGTKIWLNSASSLKFPTAFAKNERVVEITGEAYFEVAKDKARPFIVKTATQSLEVLGTHFNINAYEDEPNVATTLMEGSVRLSSLANGKTQLLKPGQQAKFKNDFKVSEFDTDIAIDWKNGNFKFAKENIQSIMRKIARWYDVEIIYKGDITNEGFVGTVPRDKNIEEVLNSLKLTGLINYKISGKQVTITP
jgi:transmembrane sensor